MPPKSYVTDSSCNNRHRLLNWMVATILIIVGLMVTIMGLNAVTSHAAADVAATVKTDLAKQEGTEGERIKRIDDSITSLQAQMNRRFEAQEKTQKRLEDKVDKILDKMSK